MLTEALEEEQGRIKIANYTVVNGCQSLAALYANRGAITDDLRLLTKFVQVKPGTGLSERITHFSNNQNGVKARDFKANNPIQVRLQNEFKTRYGDSYAYEIKRGEQLKAECVLSNEEAGLFLISFDLKEPWTTHRKYQIFEDKYAEIFGRPEVTADRLVLLKLIFDAILNRLPAIANQVVARYALTNFLVLYVVRQILEFDDWGKKVIADPGAYVADPKMRKAASAVMDELLLGLIVDLDVDTKDLPGDFDYRDKLRDKVWVESLAGGLVAGYIKDVKRKKAQPLIELWDKQLAAN